MTIVLKPQEIYSNFFCTLNEIKITPKICCTFLEKPDFDKDEIGIIKKIILTDKKELIFNAGLCLDVDKIILFVSVIKEQHKTIPLLQDYFKNHSVFYKLFFSEQMEINLNELNYLKSIVVFDELYREITTFLSKKINEKVKICVF